ncbi:MAG: hypothetical protein KDA25_00920 [Phycisphaerales bacterium]|nr:hypothetical protein [Phycisphaerales bacterium]
MEQLLAAVAEHLGWVVVGGMIVLIVLIKAMTTVLVTISQERSRREIAAYIASGTLTPEQGERLIRAHVASSVSREV